MNILFTKLIITRFYSINAGFFLFLFIVLFALLPGTDTMRLHYALMQAMTGSWGYLLVGMAVFTLYMVKCLGFFQQEIDAPQNSFLFNVQAIPDRQQLMSYGFVTLSLYLPVLIYGCFTAFVGFKEHHYVTGVAMLLWQVALLWGGSYTCFRWLNSSWRQPFMPLPRPKIFRRKNYFLYLIYHSLYERKGAFIAIKFFSLLLLQFLVTLNAGKTSKENCCFVILLCLSAHALLPMYYVKFTEKELGFLRNMPVSNLKRLGLFVVTYALLFLPELLFLLLNEQNTLSFEIMGSLYALFVSRMTLFTALQYFNKMTMERYTTFILVFFFISIIVMATINLWILVTLELAVAALIFNWRYYGYEGVQSEK